MSAKFVYITIILASLLTNCSLASPKISPTTTPTSAPTLESIQPLAPLSVVPYPPPASSSIPSSTSQLSANLAVLNRAADIILALKNRDMTTLANYVHPQMGLRLSPYASIRETDRLFQSNKVAALFTDRTVYTWGFFSGSGAPINLDFAGYYSQFIYDVDFANAPQMALNHRLGESTSIDNSHDFYPGEAIIEFYFPGFDPQYENMDWRSLRLVFSELNGAWYLVGIIHDQWTT